MSCETKEQIIKTALELFSQNGFLGTSMSDIASQLKITKGALYKHYESKQQILEQIIERMAKLDLERAKKYEMPETEQKKFAEAYIHIPTEKIREYSIAQFRHWTEENFSAKFRKMLTLEQFRSKEMSDLYQNYLGTGPLEYMTKIFKKMTKSKQSAQSAWNELEHHRTNPRKNFCSSCNSSFHIAGKFRCEKTARNLPPYDEPDGKNDNKKNWSKNRPHTAGK